jgi:hypothetical protein
MATENPEQRQAAVNEETHAMLMAVTAALSEAEQRTLLDEAYKRYPRLHGALVADILEYTDNWDEFLNITEPFFELFRDQFPGDLNIRIAAHALILLGRPLTPPRIMALLQKAGVTAVPRYPDVVAGIVTEDGEDANTLLISARAEQGMRAAGVDEGVITDYRLSVRHATVIGYARNTGDIAAWVTLADCHTPMPRKPYEPLHDLAVVVLAAHDGNYRSRTSPELAQALANLREHADLHDLASTETSLRLMLGKGK